MLQGPGASGLLGITSSHSTPTFPVAPESKDIKGFQWDASLPAFRPDTQLLLPPPFLAQTCLALLAASFKHKGLPLPGLPDGCIHAWVGVAQGKPGLQPSLVPPVVTGLGRGQKWPCQRFQETWSSYVCPPPTEVRGQGPLLPAAPPPGLLPASHFSTLLKARGQH